MDETPPGKIAKVPLERLNSEESADDLVHSETMRPYVKVAEAMLAGKGLKDAIKAVSELPLERRYVWRILSALKWAFADFDSVNVAVDRRTLSDQDRMRVAELITHRPVQFCLFLKALVGDDAMEQMMMKAVAVAKKVPSVRS